MHRADRDIVIADGTHALPGSSLRLLRGWYPIEMLHLPVRTPEQGERKYVTATSAWERDPTRATPHYLTTAYAAYRGGRLREHFRSLAVDDEALAKESPTDRVVDDRFATRWRYSAAVPLLPSAGGRESAFLRPLRSGRPGELRGRRGGFADADVARLRRRLDELETRVAVLGRTPGREVA